MTPTHPVLGDRPGAPVAPAGSDDAEVIRASWEQPERFTELYRRYADILYRYAYQRIGTDADDIVAETFLAAFRRRQSYDVARPDARPWLFGILTRALAGHRRAERSRYRAFARSGPEPAVDCPADRVAERVTAAAAHRRLTAGLSRLPAGDRDVLLLVAWGGLSYDEVAAALSIPAGTVASRLNRARRKLRRALGDGSSYNIEEM